MERHTFSALVTLDPSARLDLVVLYLDRTPTHGVLQGCGRYFPATICCGESPSPQRMLHVLLHIPLLLGEADALFADGQSFSFWADAIASDLCIHGTDLIGDGVILGRLPASDQNALQTAEHRLTPYRRASPPTRTRHATPAGAGRP